MSCRINHLYFQVEHLEPLEAFYGDLLGMELSQHGDRYDFCFPDGQTALSFHTGARASYQHTRDDFYWKLGITVPALDKAVTYLRKHAYTVSDPVQFRDIGYLAHLQDPAGFNIELLQHGFSGAERPVDGEHPLAQNATLAHLTLRVHDIDRARAFLIHQLGLRLISIQPVAEHAFCLYFFTWHHETAPNTDLKAVANREWLWRRPYLMIELQHLQNPITPLRHQPDDMCRFDGFNCQGLWGTTQHRVTLDDLSALF